MRRSHGFSFGDDTKNGFIGVGDFGLGSTAKSHAGFSWAEYLFQVALASTSSSMLAGAAAERLTNVAFLASAMMMSTLVGGPGWGPAGALACGQRSGAASSRAALGRHGEPHGRRGMELVRGQAASHVCTRFQASLCDGSPDVGAPPVPAAPQAYPLASHWVWADTGFLKAARGDALFGTGAIDFAGAGAVHALGGISALWCTKLIRERIGRFDSEGYVSGPAGWGEAGWLAGLGRAGVQLAVVCAAGRALPWPRGPLPLVGGRRPTAFCGATVPLARNASTGDGKWEKGADAAPDPDPALQPVCFYDTTSMIYVVLGTMLVRGAGAGACMLALCAAGRAAGAQRCSEHCPAVLGGSS